MMNCRRACFLTALSCAILFSAIHVADAYASLQFVKVLPLGSDDQRSNIIIKNVGNTTAKLEGWSLVDTKQPVNMNTYWFGGDNVQLQRAPVKWCQNFTEIKPDKELVLKPYNRNRFSGQFFPCGFRFNLGESGNLELRNTQGKPVDRVSWNYAKEGMAVYRMGDSFIPFVENQDLKNSIDSAPVLKTFAKALRSTGVLDKYLKDGASISIKEDSWFDKQLKKTGYSKTYYKGPWTIFAPSDKAFKGFMKEMGWYGMDLTEEELLSMPELEDILLYHIVIGQQFSSNIRNSTGLSSMKDGAEVSVFYGPDGEFLVHDDCVDRPSPDDFGCAMQAEWRKCDEDWVQDEGLFSGRTLGYCERSCERCSCDNGECALAEIYDIPSSNGVLHVIDKVMYPAPVFDIPSSHLRPKQEIQADLDSRNQ